MKGSGVYDAPCGGRLRGGRPYFYGAPPLATIKTVDAFAREMVGVRDEFSTDEASVPMLALLSRAVPKTLEHRLIYTIIKNALDDAAWTGECPCKTHTIRAENCPCILRREAREWLRNCGALFSASYCFEQMGIEYRPALRALEATWRKPTGNRTNHLKREVV